MISNVDEVPPYGRGYYWVRINSLGREYWTIGKWHPPGYASASQWALTAFDEPGVFIAGSPLNKWQLLETGDPVGKRD